MIAIKKEGEEPFCKNHPEEPATGQCKACGAALCYDCKCIHYGATYCEACFEAKRARDAKNDWMFPAASYAIIAVTALLLIVSAVGLLKIAFMGKGHVEAAALYLAWHVPDAVLVVCAIGAFKFAKWARKGLIFGGALSALRGGVWQAVPPLMGLPVSLLFTLFHAFVIIYGVAVALFYSSKALRDEFRAVRP